MKTYNKNLIKYNLKSLRNTDEKSQIFLIYARHGIRLRYYIRKRIEPKFWDNAKQRAKSTYSGYSKLNMLLNTLSNFLEDEVNKLIIKNEKVAIEKLREILDERLDKEDEKESSFLTFYDEFLESSKNVRKTSTLRNYTSALGHLKKFAQSENISLTFESFNSKFEQKFRDYLINEYHLANNSISRYFKALKTVLNWSVERGYNKNLEFRKFKNKYSDGEIYFLTWDELMNLYNLELSDEKLKKVRDIFCFGCFTGLRYSDIQNLKQNNISNDFIEINTIKTNSKIRIPLNRFSREIYNRYKSEHSIYLLPTLSNTKANEYLKEIGEIAKINSPVNVTHYSGTKREDYMVPKYSILSTHVARKTFITNAMIKGMTTEVIMDITSHSSYKTFKRYFKIVDDHKKAQMESVFG